MSTGMHHFQGLLLLSVQLAHGADSTMKNHEGQTPLDIAAVSASAGAPFSGHPVRAPGLQAEDVRCLLTDAMPPHALPPAAVPPAAPRWVRHAEPAVALHLHNKFGRGDVLVPPALPGWQARAVELHKENSVDSLEGACDALGGRQCQQTMFYCSVKMWNTHWTGCPKLHELVIKPSVATHSVRPMAGDSPLELLVRPAQFQTSAEKP